MEEYAVQGEVIPENPDLETVNNHLLKRLDDLIKEAGDDSILDLTECVAKLNASLRNNQVFTPKETEGEANARRTAATVAEILGK